MFTNKPLLSSRDFARAMSAENHGFLGENTLCLPLNLEVNTVLSVYMAVVPHCCFCSGFYVGKTLYIYIKLSCFRLFLRKFKKIPGILWLPSQLMIRWLTNFVKIAIFIGRSWQYFLLFYRSFFIKQIPFGFFRAWFSYSALGMLLDFRKAKKHSPIGSCFYYAFQKSRNIPRARRIRVSCTEIYTVFVYSEQFLPYPSRASKAD